MRTWGGEPRAVEQAIADANENLQFGTQLGRYLLLRKLGAVSMGIVFEAYDADLERRFAIKFIHINPSSNSEMKDAPSRQGLRSALYAESQALAKLSHPNVMAIYDVGHTSEHVFMAMELIAGGDLHSWRRPKRVRGVRF